VIEFFIEAAGKYLFKFYEKNAEAQNLVLSIQKFIKVGAPEEARKCCYELIRLRHKHPDVYFLLATAQYELKEYDNCLKAIQEAIQIQSSHSYWELKGDALKALERHQEAVSAYNQAIKLNSSSEEAKQKRDACQAMLSPSPSSRSTKRINRHQDSIDELDEIFRGFSSNENQAILPIPPSSRSTKRINRHQDSIDELDEIFRGFSSNENQAMLSPSPSSRSTKRINRHQDSIDELDEIFRSFS
jgi:tetratricopeptide (TPR) repeat protein